MSGLKIGTRGKLLIAALGLLVSAGCAPVGYYDAYPYGYSSGAVVYYQPYPSRSYYHGHGGHHHRRSHWR